MEEKGLEARGRTVEEIFEDYKGRRAAIIKALTTGNAPSSQIPIYFLRFFPIQ